MNSRLNRNTETESSLTDGCRTVGLFICRKLNWLGCRAAASPSAGRNERGKMRTFLSPDAALGDAGSALPYSEGARCAIMPCQATRWEPFAKLIELTAVKTLHDDLPLAGQHTQLEKPHSITGGANTLKVRGANSWHSCSRGWFWRWHHLYPPHQKSAVSTISWLSAWPWTDPY